MATYAQADYLLIPLLDEQFSVAQIFEVAGNAPPFCGLTHLRVGRDATPAPLALSDVTALVRVDDAAIAAGLWPLAGFDQIPRFRKIFNYDAARALGFPDTPVHEPAVIEAFCNAWHGLYPWDGFGDLFDRIKRADLDRPAAAT